MNIRNTIRAAAAAAVALVLPACAEEAGDGTVDVRIYGEEFIEEGIPADVFVDGWSVSFTRFLVAVDGIATPDAEDPKRYLYDLTPSSNGEGFAVASLASASGETLLEYRVGIGAAADGGNAMADATMMEENGYSVFVEGTGTKGAQSIAFAWGFTTETHYHECEVASEVPDGGAIDSVITIHADHLFYDDLESPEPNVAFDLVAAADTDMDGTATPEELAATDITSQSAYQVGSRDITDLWHFIEAQTQTLGHIDGEGHCHTE